MPQKSGLVSQHLERVHIDTLDKFETIIRDYVGKREGVYALYKQHELYYVGLASDLRTRLGSHLKDRHSDKWDHFSVYLTVDDQHMRELESLMLRVIWPKPEGNKNKGKFAMSESLMPRITADIRRLQKEELRRLTGAGLKRPKKIADEVEDVLSNHVRRNGKNLRLQARYKKKVYRAVVQKDGTVRYKNRKYMSPSAAAEAVIERGACNGWVFWCYERAPGQWVRLTGLRKK